MQGFITLLTTLFSHSEVSMYSNDSRKKYSRQLKNLKTTDEIMLELLRRFIAIVYIAVMTLSFYGPVGPLPWNTSYLLWFCVFCGAVFYIGTSGDFKDLELYTKWLLLFSSSFLIMMFASLCIWVFNVQPFDYMHRAFTRFIYNIFVVMGAVSSVYLFRFDAVYYSFYAAICANGIILLNVIRRFGPVTFVKGFIEMYLTKFEVEIPVMRALEIHDLTFAIGLYVLVFILLYKKIRYPIIHIGVGLFFMAIGLKRIAVLAIMAALVLNFLITRFKEGQHKKLRLCMIWALVFTCFGLIIAIKTGLYEATMDALGIDTLGRTKLYNLISEHYTLGPGYMGHGMGFVTETMENWFEKGYIAKHLNALHCDVLAEYIDLGFWGYIVWIIFDLPLRFSLYTKEFGNKASAILFALMFGTWITYFSDNTYIYPYFNYAYRVLAMGAAIQYLEAENQRKWK